MAISVLMSGMEGDGEVIITPVQNCSHCESGECHETLKGTECYCDDDLVLAADGVSCINSTGTKFSQAAFVSLIV